MRRKPTIAEKIEVLQLARNIIANRKHSWICYAMIDVELDSKRLAPASMALQEYIGKVLEHGNPDPQRDPTPTLAFWIRKHRPELWRGDHERVLRQYRLQWINWMISCLTEDLTKERKPE